MRQRTRSRRTRAAITALALATAFAITAAPARATVGGVYFDGNANAAAGDPSQLFNTTTFTGDFNVGLGRSVMPELTTGGANTAIGADVLDNNTNGSSNTAIGFDALTSNRSGQNNVAAGRDALRFNKFGFGNVAVGYQALFHGTGSRNVAIGPNAGINLTFGSRNVDIANPGVAGESGTIRIGTDANQDAAFLAGVWNSPIGGPTKAVVVNSKGKLGVAPTPAAARKSQARTIGRLRDRVGQLANAVQRLRQQVQRGD